MRFSYYSDRMSVTINTGAVLDRIFMFVVSTGCQQPLHITNMAVAANFVVITNGGGCALTGTADIDQ